MGIPVVNEIIGVISWLFQSMPSPFNWVFFILLISLFISLISIPFDLFGWGHPRFGVPASCMNASYQMSNYTSYSGNAECNVIAGCINDYNTSCQCECMLTAVFGGVSHWDLYCGGRNWIGQLQDEKCQFETLDPTDLYSNITLADMCIGTNHTAVVLYKQFRECETAGIDILDKKLLWGSAIMFSLFIIFMKFLILVKT